MIALPVDAEPEELTCPICYTMFRDPVIPTDEPRVYERDALLAFWRRRPLASFFGGESLPSARMEPALHVREQVAAWLAAHPGRTPEGWTSREPGPTSSPAELDRLASEIAHLAAVRRAAEAAEAFAADEDRDPGGAGGEALLLLRAQATAVRLRGATGHPARAAFTGRYVRRDDLPLLAGRFAFAKQGDPDKMLWFARNGFWHAGRAADLGRQTGFLIVADSAGAPEHIVGEWQVAGPRGSGFVPAPGLRCEPDEAEPGEGEEGGGGSGGLSGDDEAEAEARASGSEEAEVWARQLAEAAPVVRLEGEPHRQRHGWTATWSVARRWLGSYDKLDRVQVGGRHVYCRRGSSSRVLWFTAGFWHFGHIQYLGSQTAALFVADSAACPEAIGEEGVWHVGLPSRGWAPLHELRVRAGAEPPPQPRPLPSAMLPVLVGLVIVLAASTGLRVWLGSSSAI